MSTDYKIIDNAYLEGTPGAVLINKEQDFLDLLGKVYSQRKLLLHQSNLNPDFFDLSTGLAGEILQKMVNYQIKTAFIVEPASIKSKHFHELITEANWRDEYRFFSTKDEAIEWLLS